VNTVLRSGDRSLLQHSVLKQPKSRHSVALSKRLGRRITRRKREMINHAGNSIDGLFQTIRDKHVRESCTVSWNKMWNNDYSRASR
jgi:transcriptional regulator of acetoin/glycerol metabolism